MLVAYRIATYELAEVDALVEWFREDSVKRARRLESLAGRGGSSNRYVDNIEAIRSVSQLNSELSIVALWRCVELCRKRLIQGSLGNEAAREAWTHRKALEKLKDLGIPERTIHDWKTVDELRCLNNVIKHAGYIEGPLLKHGAWTPRAGEILEGLEIEYPRLRLAAENYIKDLALQASKSLMSAHA